MPLFSFLLRRFHKLQQHLYQRRQKRLLLQHTATLISLMLKEPERVGLSILLHSLHADARMQQSYRKLLTNKSQVLKLVQRLCTGQMDALNHWLKPGCARILASAHTSHYLLGILVLLYQVREIGDVMLIKRMSNSPSEQLFIDFAANYCDSLSTAQPNSTGLKAALKHLRGGGCLIMMIDVPLHFDVGQGERVEFFGQPLITSAAISRLALKTEAIVFPAAVIKTAQSTIVNLRQPFIATGELTSEAITQRLMGDVEHWVRLAPDDWMIWGHMLHWHQCSITNES